MPTRRTHFFAPMACAVAALALALPSAASAAKSTCTYPSTSQAFAQWGDLNSYYLADGGALESLTWTASGPASVVAGNEPWFLADQSHSRSLRLAKGATVVTGRFCVSAELPHARFVARGSGGDLDVRVDIYDAQGRVMSTRNDRLRPQDHPVWAPSRFISFETSQMTGTGQATLTFTSYGDWQVDDVFIDPYAR